MIEDGEVWHQSFPREIIAGMLNMPRSAWRHLEAISREEKAVRLSAFAREFGPHDWTKSLE